MIMIALENKALDFNLVDNKTSEKKIHRHTLKEGFELEGRLFAWASKQPLRTP